MEPIHCVLVVDDEAKIVDVVKAYLEKSGYRVFTASTGKEALGVLAIEKISLILLDLMLPDMTGESVCKQIRSHSNLPIIMMTAKTDEESIINGLTIGADDYVTKPFSPRQLMARVGAILRRQSPQQVEPSIIRFGSLAVHLESHSVQKNGVKVPVTRNEYKILALLLLRPQKIFTRDEIIELTRETSFEGFDRTVDTHIKNLRKKIEEDPKKPKYILTVHGLGYRFGGEILD